MDERLTMLSNAWKIEHIDHTQSMEIFWSLMQQNVEKCLRTMSRLVHFHRVLANVVVFLNILA
jgi:hypothetical protein